MPAVRVFSSAVFVAFLADFVPYIVDGAVIVDRAGKGVGLREASQEVQLKTLRDTCLEHWYAIAHENQHLTTASLKQRIEEQAGAEGDSIRVSFYVYQSQFAASI